MKLGIVLPSYIYSQIRGMLLEAAMESMARTVPIDQKPELLLIVKEGDEQRYNKFRDPLSKAFYVSLTNDHGLTGTEMTLAFGTDLLCRKENVSHVMWMGDDALFNSMWLHQLTGLIERHPDAICWSVYRSAFEEIHSTIRVEEDVLVKSICGHGFTITAKEWRNWGIKWEEAQGYGWMGTKTMDLMHAESRVGERWVTKKSYVQHCGRIGIHCSAEIPEYAIDFQYDGEPVSGELDDL